VKQSYWHRRVVQPLVELLRQGITPEKIAITIALGVTLGVTPVLGSTTLLCTLAAIALRLNLPAIQLVNWLAYPLQLALLVPFLRAGAWMFGEEPASASLAHILSLVRSDVFLAVSTLWTATLHALVAWLAVGSLATVLIFLLLAPVLRWMRVQARPAVEVSSHSR
jgi:uncharacterized protein (DUF2062 family)